MNFTAKALVVRELIIFMEVWFSEAVTDKCECLLGTS
jgi:hypothetical protein